MKKSDLVSVQVLVQDALEFFRGSDFFDLTNKERYVLLTLLDLDSHLLDLNSVPDEC